MSMHYKDCFVTYEDLESLSDGKPVIPGIIMETHIIAMVAKPGVGKSAVLRHMAEEMVRNGYEVHYLDVDSSASQIKRQGRQMLDAGVHYAAPQIKPERSVQDLIDGLKAMGEAKEKPGNLVIIMDTTKKFMNMMSKVDIKEFFLMLRAIGGTVVMAAHANKHQDDDNKIVYEGTGDLESDCDDMLMLYCDKDEERQVQTISSYIHKSRSTDIKPQSWQLSLSDMSVQSISYIDLFAKDGEVDEIPKPTLPFSQQTTMNILLALQATDSSSMLVPYKDAKSMFDEKDIEKKGRWDANINHLRQKGYLAWSNGQKYIKLTRKGVGIHE